ncbi:MAG: hypothetical protein H6Q17_899 [Bacteroidetes bacterium]|nr:hypothetical protein [Bacteroidota bacterium]
MTIQTKHDETPLPEDKIVFYELEKVRFVVKDGTGLDIAYAYEDLVFSEHALFIIQFDGQDCNSWNCWFNQECNAADRLSLLKSLTASANLNNVLLTYQGTFEMSQSEGDDEITLRFSEL